MTVSTKTAWTKDLALAFLGKGRWFGALPAAYREAIVAHGEIIRLAPHASLYRIGDSVDGLYATLDGDVRAYAIGDDNERIFLRPLGPGSWFGDVHLLDDYERRTFEVRTASDATVFFLPASSYRALIDSDSGYYRAFVQLMCIHMRHTVSVIIEARSEAPRRTARALLRLARAHGIPTQAGMRLGINLSQSDLASLVGVSRQYMNELIARWEQNRYLRWNGKAQPVLDLTRLRTLLSPLDTWMDDTEDWV